MNHEMIGIQEDDFADASLNKPFAFSCFPRSKRCFTNPSTFDLIVGK